MAKTRVVIWRLMTPHFTCCCNGMWSKWKPQSCCTCCRLQVSIHSSCVKLHCSRVIRENSLKWNTRRRLCVLVQPAHSRRMTIRIYLNEPNASHTTQALRSTSTTSFKWVQSKTASASDACFVNAQRTSVRYLLRCNHPLYCCNTSNQRSKRRSVSPSTLSGWCEQKTLQRRFTHSSCKCCIDLTDRRAAVINTCTK